MNDADLEYVTAGKALERRAAAALDVWAVAGLKAQQAADSINRMFSPPQPKEKQ
jgi:hypothetical protein